MAHGRQEFPLVGYSEDLERNSLKFVDPIPASRICSACGNIPRQMFMLVCGHNFCEPCYESCSTTSECVCPLDGETCAPAVVTSKEYPAEQLLRRKVHCWNEANGCGVVVPASQVADHLRHDCRHHVTRCPTCSARVLSRDVCAHLKSSCTALVLHAAPEPQGKDACEKTDFAQWVGEIDAKLAQLSLNCGAMSDKLADVCSHNSQVKEALTEQVKTALDSNLAYIKALYAQKSESLRTALTSTSTSVPSDSKTHHRDLTGYAELKKEALKYGCSESWSDEVYLRGYKMSWGIYFEKKGDGVNLFLFIQLHKGREDEFVDWPFRKELKLSIIHPDTRQERQLHARASPSDANDEFFRRPIERSNEDACFDETKIASGDIELNGYVKEDQLLLSFEVL